MCKIPVVNDILDGLKLRFLESEFLIGDVNNLWKTRIVIIFGTKSEKIMTNSIVRKLPIGIQTSRR